MKKLKWNELAEERRNLLNMSQAELGDRLGVGQGTIGNWLKGRREPELATIMHIFKALGVELVTFDQDTNVSVDENALVSVPQLKVTTAIEFRGQDIGEPLSLDEEEVIHYFSPDVRAYAIRIDGEKLEPRIVSGEYLVVEPGTKLQSYDEVLIKRKDGKYLVRVLLTGRSKEWRYADPNTMEQDADFDPNEIEEMAYIAAIIKPPRKR